MEFHEFNTVSELELKSCIKLLKDAVNIGSSDLSVCRIFDGYVGEDRFTKLSKYAVEVYSMYKMGLISKEDIASFLEKEAKNDGELLFLLIRTIEARAVIEYEVYKQGKSTGEKDKDKKGAVVKLEPGDVDVLTP